MKRLALLSLVVALGSCADESGTPRLFPDSDIVLGVGNGARFGCTCLFVMEMSEEYCRAWIKASPDVAKVSIDYGAKTVESTAFVSWSAKAHFVDSRRGCILE